MKISAAESRIMDVLWREGRPLASEDVTELLGDSAEWSHGTVRTFLTRLVKKKAVSTRKEGRRYLYTPLIRREAYVRGESRDFLDRLFDGRLAPFLTQFAGKEDLTREEVEALRRFIAELDDDR